VSDLHEECGLFGIYGPENDVNVAWYTYNALFQLQHRGQSSAGIAVNNDGDITCHKDLGLVDDVFNAEVLGKMSEGQFAIGHVRYATNGAETRENAHPLVIKYHNGPLALAHNGAISNADKLRKELEDGGAIFQSTNDTEVIAHLIARERKETESIEETMPRVMKYLEGAYCLLILTKHKMIAVRDPYGFRPLCMAKAGKSVIFSSETCALDVIKAKFVRDVAPGEIISVTKNGINEIMPENPGKSHICVFEYIYNARPDSVIDGRSVYKARIRAGIELAKQYPVDADIVFGVPDSGSVASIGYAHESGIKHGIGFIKNRYVGRTFIMETQDQRIEAVRKKLSVLTDTVKGKRVIVVDDSIVRGTTSMQIINLLREAGAKEVHMRISYPPFMHPCYYGTDIPSQDALIACQMPIDEIAKTIGADSLGFLSMESLKTVLKNDELEEACKGCASGVYPDR